MRRIDDDGTVYEVPGDLDYYPERQNRQIEDDRARVARTIEALAPSNPPPLRRLLDGTTGEPGSVDRLPSGGSSSLIKVAGDIAEAVTIFAQMGLGKNRQTNDDVYLKIKWGIGNLSCEADVDIQKGVAIGLICKSLEVVAYNGGTASASIYVGAAVGYGMRAAAAPPQRTLAGGAVAFGATGARVTIPNYARGVYPIPLVTTAGQHAADFVVKQLDKANNVISEHPFVYSGAPYLSPARLMLLNNAYSLEIDNVDAANDLTMNWLFDLAL